MNKEGTLEEGEVVRVAIALKGLREFKDKTLDELIDTACNLMLFSRERIQIAERDYRLRKSKEGTDSSQIIPFVEAAKSITSHSKIPRALDMFCRFLEYLSGPNDLVPEQEFSDFRMKLEDQEGGGCPGGGYPKGFCEELKEMYPRWRTIELSRLQAEKASKMLLKKTKKTS